MIPNEHWLTLHKLCLDTIRCAIQGLPDDQMTAEPISGDVSIGEQLSHLVGVEAYWLREVQIEPKFTRPAREAWTEGNFLAVFEEIERQYEEVLGTREGDPDVLFGLGRACQHALYHFVRITALRASLAPGWEPSRGLRWERAVDYISHLLIIGAEAEPMYED